MNSLVHSREAGKHLGPLQIFGVSLMLGFVVAWSSVAFWLLIAVLAYGLFGVEIGVIGFRPVAFMFSITFVVVAALGFVSLAASILKAHASRAVEGE